MKAKTLVVTAIICASSIFGMNLTSAYAATQNFQPTKIDNDMQVEQLSQKVRDRNTAIGAILGIAAIAAIANHNDKHHNDKNNNYNRNRHNSHNHHHHRR